MKRTVTAAAIALTAGSALIETPAHAATGMSLTCRSGETNITITLRSHVVDGLAVYNDIAWTTRPAARLDRLTLTQIPDAPIVIKGGSSSTQNDVPTAGTAPGTYVIPTSGTTRIRLSVWGGKGDSRDTCTKTKSV